MNKELEKILKENMSATDLVNTEELPALNTMALDKIKARKAYRKNNLSVFLSVIVRIFSPYKIPLIGCFILITLTLINKTEFTTNNSAEYTTTYNTEDTVLTVSSHTYLASLHQPTVLQLPAKTNTALTCITTIICKN